MKEQINNLLLKMQTGENCIGETANQLLDLFTVSGSLPTREQSKWAMLRRKTKFVHNMDRFSSRKNAYKQGWRDCFEWIRLKRLSFENEQLKSSEDIDGHWDDRERSERIDWGNG
jgi:hypothetical protein